MLQKKWNKVKDRYWKSLHIHAKDTIEDTLKHLMCGVLLEKLYSLRNIRLIATAQFILILQ